MFKVITLRDASLWSNLWHKLPLAQQSVFLLPEYYKIYELIGHGEAGCMLYEREAEYFLYPFLKRALNKLNLYVERDDLYDIEGAYGLNGYGSSHLSDSSRKFILEQWSRYCRENNIIAEFTRFNPLHKNSNDLHFLNSVVVNQSVVVDLYCNDVMYDSYEHSVRKNIKKAIKHNVEVISFASKNLSDNYLESFINIYGQTMDRNEASKFYYFNADYFKMIRDFIPENSRWFFSVVNKKIVSVELILFDANYCYSFLGGTIEEYLPCGANVLLKHEVVTFFKSLGLKSFFLGGGVSVNDGVFKYKKSFCKSNAYDFEIGKKIHLEFEYRNIVEQWEARNPEKKELYKNHILKYWY